MSNKDFWETVFYISIIVPLRRRAVSQDFYHCQLQVNMHKHFFTIKVTNNIEGIVNLL